MIAKTSVLRAAAFGVMVWGATAATGCTGYVVAEPVYYPPSAFLGSTAPTYYEGRPAWYYNDRWYFRSGTGWAYYRSEPAYLYRARTVYGAPANAYVRGQVHTRR
jgi:hypothetical protein